MQAGASVIVDREALLEKLAALAPRAFVRILLGAGVPAVWVLGGHCAEHHTQNARTLTDAESLAFDQSVLWCTDCHRWWRR